MIQYRINLVPTLCAHPRIKTRNIKSVALSVIFIFFHVVGHSKPELKSGAINRIDQRGNNQHLINTVRASLARIEDCDENENVVHVSKEVLLL